MEAGGVGSIATQSARQVIGLTVITTASRPETAAWRRALGPHNVLDHSKPLAAEINNLGIASPFIIFSTTHTEARLEEIDELIAPPGRFALIDDPSHLDANPLKRERVSIQWEFIFTRSMFDTSDIAAQGDPLNKPARLVDATKIRSTVDEI